MQAILYTNSFFRKYFFISLFVMQIGVSTGQTIYSNTFTGTGACPTQGNTPTVASNATGTPLTRSTITCTPSANVFNSETINNTSSVDNNSYIEFSVTAAAQAKLTVTSLSFFRQASASAPNQLEVRYSTDGFVTSTSWGNAPLSPTVGSAVTWDFPDFSVPASTTLTFRFYPYGTQRADLATGASNGTVGTFRLDDVTLNGSSPLPVNLVSFAAKSGRNGITLNWVTAWEEENQGFEIQKSTNAKSFERIATVAGKSTSYEQSVYEFTDLDVQPGQLYYYRLKQKDVGGGSSLSKIVAVQTNGEQATNAVIFPNPSKGRFTLMGQTLSPADTRLYAPSGLEIPISIEETEDQNSLTIWAKTFLPAGVYYLRVSPDGGARPNAIKVLVEP